MDKIRYLGTTVDNKVSFECELSSWLGEMGISPMLPNLDCKRLVYWVFYSMEWNPGQPMDIKDEYFPPWITKINPGNIVEGQED